jgi:hypothetical protein
MLQHKIVVPRKNLWGYWDHKKPWGNIAHYDMLREWCVNHLPKGDWESHYNSFDEKKEFWFKDEKVKTLFLLRWSDECR